MIFITNANILTYALKTKQSGPFQLYYLLRSYSAQSAGYFKTSELHKLAKDLGISLSCIYTRLTKCHKLGLITRTHGKIKVVSQKKLYITEHCRLHVKFTKDVICNIKKFKGTIAALIGWRYQQYKKHNANSLTRTVQHGCALSIISSHTSLSTATLSRYIKNTTFKVTKRRKRIKNVPISEFSLFKKNFPNAYVSKSSIYINKPSVYSITLDVTRRP